MRRTILGLFLGPVLWIVPIAYGLTMIQIDITPVPVATLAEALIMQILLVTLAEQLFFREAPLRRPRHQIQHLSFPLTRQSLFSFLLARDASI